MRTIRTLPAWVQRRRTRALARHADGRVVRWIAISASALHPGGRSIPRADETSVGAVSLPARRAISV